MLDPLAEAALFHVDAPPPISLADKFGFPPISVLDRRSGPWQDRKRAWLSIGIQSELGRGDDLLTLSHLTQNESYNNYGTLAATSIFDPVLCEVAYRWFTAAGDIILDPFAGGSVRGVTAAILERQYVGIDLREEQVAANRAQLPITDGHPTPKWTVGDSRDLTGTNAVDFVFSCPPYADLEKYSEDPRDLSNAGGYDEFLTAYRQIIAAAGRLLRPNRFAAWVISDIRDKKTGFYRGLIGDTIAAFEAAGMHLVNDLVILDPLGTVPVRVERYFRANRKTGRVHQHMLVFCNGTLKPTAQRLEAAPPPPDTPASEDGPTGAY